MKKLLSLMLVATIIISLNSCALIFNGTKQNVSVKSMTPNSKIYIDGDLAGTDAVSKKLSRKNNHTIMIKKSECRTETVMIDSEVQAGWIIFDALFNWCAFLTDAPTGAWKSFDKTNVTVELDCSTKN
jgi:hypothetical protein